jgi:hypothetical protein
MLKTILFCFICFTGTAQSFYDEPKPSLLEVRQPTVNIKTTKVVSNGGALIGLGGLMLLATGIYGLAADKKGTNFHQTQQIGFASAGLCIGIGGIIISTSSEN